MYYHIVIKPKSDRFYGEYKCDLTEEQLLSRYINSYAEGRSIVINGKTIKPDDLERIRITTTPAPAQTYVPALEAEDRNSSVVVLGGPSYLQQAIASGSDVADDYIKGPPGFSRERMPSMVETHPGNSSDRSILEQIRR